MRDSRGGGSQVEGPLEEQEPDENLGLPHRHRRSCTLFDPSVDGDYLCERLLSNLL